MFRSVLAFMACSVIVSAFAQTTAQPKYQPGTVLAVERHRETDANSDQTRYDLTVKIDNTVYVVLFTPRYGSNTIEYTPGLEMLFAVAKDRLIFPGKSDRIDAAPQELPILSVKQLPPQSGFDWSKAPSQYFTMKMKNLTTSLNLSDEQQVKIKPIAEQETAEADNVIFTPVVPRKERLNEWEKMVRKSDEKMKPILTEAQWQKLQEMRKDQKRELTELIAKQDKAEDK